MKEEENLVVITETLEKWQIVHSQIHDLNMLVMSYAEHEDGFLNVAVNLCEISQLVTKSIQRELEKQLEVI